MKSKRTGKLARPHYPEQVYQSVVGHPAEQAGVETTGVHALRATAATNALLRAADSAKVQQWRGHATKSTTRIYERRAMRSEAISTFRVSY